MSPHRAPHLLVLLALAGCKNWEFSRDDEVLDPSVPYRISILETESCALPEGLDPKKVAIHSYRIRIRGQRKGGVPANYFYASVLTTDGSRYLAEYPGCSPLLSGPSLSPGDFGEGFVNFPMPPSKTPETLIYAPELPGLAASESTIEVSIRPSAEIDVPHTSSAKPPQ